MPLDEEKNDAPEPSLLDDVAQAYEKLEAKEVEPAVAGEKPQAEAEVAGKEAPGKAPARDEGGRFAPKSKEAAPPVATEPALQPAAPIAGEQQVAPPAPVTTNKAPASWKPAEREAWARVPAEAQAAIVRREQETSRALQESAEARRSAGAFAEVVRPFEGMIRAEGGEPLRAVANLLQTAAALRTAPPAHRAQLVAGIVRQYGVPIDELDRALSGAAGASGGPAGSGGALPPAAYRDPRVDQLFEQVQAASKQRAEATAVEVAHFIDANEFGADLKNDMAALIHAAAVQGRAMSLDQAYKIASQTHPEVSKVLAQRAAAAQAGTAQAATQRARHAASSVQSKPAPKPPTPSTGDNVHDDVARLYEELSTR